ncbi:aminoacyl-tRNA hydrolase [Trichloromonas sp.]|uniref:aminoacyl-tRNA hydrolase n=1 Tax=Trichloromonas sp. TaxID=3069249 RepID=UPI003D81C258
MKLIVGLGNPGDKYAGTRHNIGFMVVQKLADRCGVQLKKKGHQGFYGVGRVAAQESTLLLPQTFMNLSGASVASAFKACQLAPGDLVVVHDDIDQPFGALKVRVGGGHGGHNGIRHICQVLGCTDFIRIKVGVGRPHPGGDVAQFVLSAFAASEQKALASVIDDSVRAVETVVERGPLLAMNEFNRRVDSI